MAKYLYYSYFLDDVGFPTVFRANNDYQAVRVLKQILNVRYGRHTLREDFIKSSIYKREDLRTLFKCVENEKRKN